MSDSTLPWLLRPFEALGRTTIAGLEYLGRFGAFLGEAVLVLFTPPLKVGALLRRIQFIGTPPMNVCCVCANSSADRGCSSRKRASSSAWAVARR